MRGLGVVAAYQKKGYSTWTRAQACSGEPDSDWCSQYSLLIRLQVYAGICTFWVQLAADPLRHFTAA